MRIWGTRACVCAHAFASTRVGGRSHARTRTQTQEREGPPTPCPSPCACLLPCWWPRHSFCQQQSFPVHLPAASRQAPCLSFRLSAFFLSSLSSDREKPPVPHLPTPTPPPPDAARPIRPPATRDQRPAPHGYALAARCTAVSATYLRFVGSLLGLWPRPYLSPPSYLS